MKISALRRKYKTIRKVMEIISKLACLESFVSALHHVLLTEEMLTA